MGKPPLLLGHRGARGMKGIRENTLQAFDLALAQGCDGFEFDVRLSQGGRAVICHDAKSRGFEIARHPARSLELPLLAEVLTRYHKKAFLDIELKVPGLESIALDLVHKHTPAQGFVLSSFRPDILQTIHRMDANMPLGLICETRIQLSRWPELPVEYVIPHCSLLRTGVIKKIKATSRKILVWTVNASAEMKRLADYGVDGIISDNPERLARILRPKAGSTR